VKVRSSLICFSAVLTNIGSQCEEAEEDLWDSILIYSYSNVDHIVQSISRAFSDNKETFDEVLTRWFGIDDVDEKGSQVDHELGVYLISLHQKTYSYDKSLRQLHNLIHFAANMTRDVLHLQIRLRCLIRKGKFAKELYHLICTLGFPERAYNTYFQAAKTSPTFTHIDFHLIPNACSPKRVHFEPPQCKTTTNAAYSLATSTTKTSTIRKESTTAKTSSTCSNNNTNVVSRTTLQIQAPKLQRLTEREQQPANLTHPNLAANQQNDALNLVRPFLARQDRSPSVVQIQPASERDTVQLIGTVLRGNLLPMSANSWYTFGFVTTQNVEEERRLGGLYAALLKDARDPTSIFREITTAMETNTVIKLFDIKGYGHFREVFPRLEAFLTAPPAKRSSVWRLKQFIHDEANTEPLPCLQRDYGFKFCKQREEVQLLKGIYARVLDKVKPRELHEACVHGALYQFAVQKGVHVDLKYKRLMQNDYPAPSVGFDNDEGLAAYSGRMFRKRQKL
jgi:hypothetical protein